MSITKRKDLLISISIMIVVAVFSFLALNAITAKRTSAQEGFSTPEMNATSIEEASKLAGYNVATLNLLSAGVRDLESVPEICVVQLRTFSRGPESRLVEQNWKLSDGSWFTFVQLPRPGESVESIMTGDQISIGNMTGKREYLEADGTVPPRVVFRWYEGGMRYALVGSLTESITEEVLVKLAQTVETK
jgi:hypothetical protein